MTLVTCTKYIPHEIGKQLRSCFIYALKNIIEYKQCFAQNPFSFLDAIFNYLIQSSMQYNNSNANTQEAKHIKAFFLNIKKFLILDYKYYKNVSSLIYKTTKILENILYHYHSYGASLYVPTNDYHSLSKHHISELLSLYKLHPFYIFVFTKPSLIQGFQVYCTNKRLECSLQRVINDLKKKLEVL